MAQQQQAEEARQKELQMKLESDAVEKEKDRQNNITIAEIRAAGYGAMKDINENKQSDYIDALDRIESNMRNQEQLSMNQSKQQMLQQQHRDKIQIQREKIQAERDRADKNLQIARINTPPPPPKKEKKK
jgi:hypothetical protein